MTSPKNVPPSKLQVKYIFRAYNYARKVANSSNKIEIGRLNRALGLVLSGRIFARAKLYGTTTKQCHCRDRQPGRYQETGRLCKHMLALMIVTRMREYMEADGLSREAAWWGEPAPTSAPKVEVEIAA